MNGHCDTCEHLFTLLSGATRSYECHRAGYVVLRAPAEAAAGCRWHTPRKTTVKEEKVETAKLKLSEAMPEALKLLLSRDTRLALHFVGMATNPDKPPADADTPEKLDAWSAGLNKPPPVKWPGIVGACAPVPVRSDGVNARTNRAATARLRELADRGELSLMENESWDNSDGESARIEDGALVFEVPVEYRTWRTYTSTAYYQARETVCIPLEDLARMTADQLDREMCEQVGRQTDVGDLRFVDQSEDYDLVGESDLEYDQVGDDCWMGATLLENVEESADLFMDDIEEEEGEDDDDD